MPGAIARPTKGSRRPDPDQDAFLETLDRFVTWIQENSRTVAVSAIGLVLLAGGLLYYASYTQNLEERASSEFQNLRAALATGADTEGLQQLQQFVERFGNTEAGLQGRILLAREHLASGKPEAAIRTVGPAADQPVDTPTGYAARSLLARAHAASGASDRALRIFSELAEEARFAFQRRQAAAERAEILAQRGELRAAADIYRRLVDEAPASASEEMYAVRLGELEARIASAESSESAGAAAGREEGP